MTLALPLLLLSLAAAPLPAADALILAGFEKGLNTEAAGKNLEFFSDKDESSTSATKVAAKPVPGGVKGQALRLSYDVKVNVSLGYQYAGAAIPLEGKDVADFEVLSFHLRSDSPQPPPLYAGMKNKANDRDRLAVADYIKDWKSGAWVKVSLPMRDFKVMRSRLMLEEMDSIAFTFETGAGSVDLDEVLLEGKRTDLGAGLGAPPAKTRAVWAKGHAVWCYHDKVWNIKRIQAYNKTTKDPSRIRYVFPWTGSYTFKPGGATVLDWEEGEALAYALALPGVEIHPIIDAASAGYEQLTDAEVDALAKLTAEKVNARKEFTGLHLDIEPHHSLILGLYVALRKYTQKPITIAVSRWSPKTFQYVDAVALMMYDLADNPQLYAKTAHRKAYEFMRDAKSVDGQAFLGFPAVATHSEWTYKVAKAGGERIESGHSWDAYMEGAFKAIQKHATGAAAASYVGLGLWGLLGNTPVGGRADAYDFYPFEISPAAWDYLRKPLE